MCSYSPSLKGSMASLFEGHHLALEYLVPNLLKLHVDIEFTGSHTQVILDSSLVLVCVLMGGIV